MLDKVPYTNHLIKPSFKSLKISIIFIVQHALTFMFSDEEIAEGYGYVRDKYIKAMGFDNYEFDPAMDTNSEDRADFTKIGDKMEIKQSVIDSLKQLFHPKAKAGFPSLTVRQFASVRV